MEEAGYTLIELTAVLMIVAILTAITLPPLHTIFDRFMLEEAAWRLARDLRQAQQLAVVQEETFHVQFQYSLNRYVIRRSGETWAVVELPPGIKMEATSFTRNEVFFYPSGAPSMGGTIPLVNKRGKKRYVKVTVATGRVRVTRER